jgi:hypothetical protein
MRVDFMKNLLEYNVLENALNFGNSGQYFFLSGLQKKELEDAIIEPARKCGYRLSNGLLDVILADIEEESNCLPLLQFTLQELWQIRDSNKRIMTIKAYKDLGRIKESLNRHAESVYDELRSTKEKEWARFLFLKLVRTGSSGEKDIRRPLKKDELSLFTTKEIEKQVLVEVMEHLVNGRLVETKEEFNLTYYYLSHEALMDGWKRLSEWLTEDRQSRKFIDSIEEAWRDWEREGKDTKFYLSEGMLYRIKEMGDKLNKYLVPPVIFL